MHCVCVFLEKKLFDMSVQSESRPGPLICWTGMQVQVQVCQNSLRPGPDQTLDSVQREVGWVTGPFAWVLAQSVKSKKA